MKTIIRKTFALLLAAVMLTALCSCTAKKGTDAGDGTDVANGNAGLANPVVQTDAAGLLEATGISLDAPEGAQNVTYAYINQASADAQLIAQVSFEFDGKSYNYRAVSTSETSLAEVTDENADIDLIASSVAEGVEKGAELAGLFYDDWNAQTIINVSYCDGVYGQSHEAVSFVAWIDVAPGFMYTMTAEDEVSQDVLLNVAELSFVPMQGEVG